MNGKRPFDIDAAFERLRRAVAPLPKAAMYQLAEEGHRSLFEQAVACVISTRTLDEVSLLAARRLFARARTPEQVSALSPEEIDALIAPCTFHEPKAHQIRQIARRVVEGFGGEVPCDRAALLSFVGIGPKCANLSLGIACGLPLISVDIHVHRVVNRWGYARARTPEKTLLALEATLPERYRVELNSLLVPFGKHVCTGHAPHCSTCPLLDMCRQVGVTSHR